MAASATSPAKHSLKAATRTSSKLSPMHPGLLESLRRGEAAALVRYEGKYAATTLTVMGDRTGFEWKDPPANNHIDELVAAKLKRTKTLPSRLTATTTSSSAACISTSPACRRRPSKFSRSSTIKRDTKVKRDELIDKLVGNDDYVDFWTNKWADLLMVNRKFLGRRRAPRLSAIGFAASWPPIGRTTNSRAKSSPPAARPRTIRPVRISKRSARPKALMENTTQLFLATRFNCNKCHDHPFERWTQDQYYHLAAYFAQIDRTKDPASGDVVIGGSAVEAGQPLYEVISDAEAGRSEAHSHGRRQPARRSRSSASTKRRPANARREDSPPGSLRPTTRTSPRAT